MEFEDRKKIEEFLKQGLSAYEIAKKMNFNASTIFGELKRVKGTYIAEKAHTQALACRNQTYRVKKMSEEERRVFEKDILTTSTSDFISKYNISYDYYYKLRRNVKFKISHKQSSFDFMKHTLSESEKSLEERVLTLELQVQTILEILKQKTDNHE